MSNGEIATGPIIYGSEGVIVADRFLPEVKVYTQLKPYVPSPPADKVYTCGEMKETLALNVINHIQNQTPLHELVTPEFNMKAMAAFDAGIRSCETGMIEDTIEPFQL